MSTETTNSRDSSVLICGAGSLIVLGITCAVLALNFQGPPPSSIGMHKYIVEFVQFGGDRNLLSQRLAHVAMLFSCGAFTLLGNAFAFKFQFLKIPRILQTISCTLVALFCLSSISWWQTAAFSKVAWIVLSIPCVFLFFVRRKIWNSNLTVLLSVIALSSIALLAVVPGLLVPFDATWMNPDLLVEFQENYSVVASQGDRIALGHRIFESVKPTYGIFLQVICALWERQFGLLSFGENIRIVRWLGAFTVVSVIFIYSWVARKRILPTAFAFLLVLPWYHTNQISLIFPNLSPWRSLGFILAFIVLIASSRLSSKLQSMLLGLTAGACLWMNIETGIVISVGLLSFLYFANHQAGNVFPAKFRRDTIMFLSSIAAFSAVFYLFFSLAFGYTPNLTALVDFLKTRQLKTSLGYFGGFEIVYAPIQILFLCHYAYVLFRTAIQTALLTTRVCIKATAATMGLVWSAYFFNRPHEWYFQPQFFFYGILLIDTVRIAQSQAWLSRTFERRSISILILLTLILPQILVSFHSATPSYRQVLEQCFGGKLANSNARKISGIFVDKDFADEIVLKVSVIEKEKDLDKVIYLTGSTLLVSRLSKTFLRADFDSPYVELDMEKDTVAFVDKIKKSSVEKVFIDYPGLRLNGGKYRMACWKNIKELLKPDFVSYGIENGWEVLRRVKSLQGSSPELGLDRATR